MTEEQYHAMLQILSAQFLKDSSSDSSKNVPMPDGPAKEPAQFVIAECNNCPHKAVTFLLMALQDCYGKLARTVKNENKFADFFNKESPLNRLVYRFVDHFGKSTDEYRKKIRQAMK